MKIATITCHDVYNYGASLQAYALQTYCISQGWDYEIVDYKPDYLSGHFYLWGVGNSIYDRPVVKQLYLLAKMPWRLYSLKRKARFDAFSSDYLKRSSRRYYNLDELNSDCPDADLYIAGSDQIWNTFFKNGHDPAFYLDFVPNHKRRISYAASFATDRIFNNADDFVRNKLCNFDAISVRESSAIRLLESLGRNDGELVCDPVFLVSGNEWIKSFGLKTSGSEYILVYDCEGSPELRRVALEVKRQTGLKIVSVSFGLCSYADKNLPLAGPIEFLKTLYSAKYVIANSFHALVFSLIFCKPFFILYRSEKINTRMQDILEYLNLQDRLISQPSQAILSPIDFDATNAKLERLIETSKTYLKAQVEACNR